MEFGLKFKTSSEKLGLFDNFHQGDGMDIVQFVNEEMGEEVLPDLIQRSCNIDMHKSEMSWTLDQKKRKGLIESYPIFKHFSTAEIIVPTGWFGQFVTQRVVPHYKKPTPDLFMPDWPFFMFIPFLTLWITKRVRNLNYKEACINHDNGVKRFELEKVVVENIYSSADIIDAWVADGMSHYWGIDEARHHEMMMREQACEEERERKKAEEERLKRAKAKELSMTDIKSISDFLLKAHQGLEALHVVLTQEIKEIKYVRK